MDEAAAARFAAEWMDAWNRHDLNDILAHYTEDVVFTSPFVVIITGDAGGTLRGKEAVRTYFERALKLYPDLHFEPLHVLCGVQSVTIVYRSVKNLLTAEVMAVDANGKVTEVRAHYTAAA